ncbi:MAG: TIR domain-containing protein [Cyanobacteria bacterium P01_H01_bin.105]
MTDVFISYSRKDKAFVQVLNQALANSKYDAWVDWENIPLTADWWEEIKAGIEGADTFIFVISPDSIASKVCGQEIDHAVENNKRLLPIVYREGFDMSLIRPALGKHNWLFFKEDNDFDQSFESLVETLNTDLFHVKTHTRLLVKALEWEKKHRNDDVLLRGSELEDAENWLSTAQQSLHEPLPTEQQQNYIIKSREVEEARQRLAEAGEKAKRLVRIGTGVLGVTVAIAAIVGALSIKAYQDLRIARVATETEQLNIEASRTFDSQQIQALLIAMKSGQQAKQLESQNNELVRNSSWALERILYTIKEKNILKGHEDHIWDVSYSSDGNYLISASRDGTAILWNAQGAIVAQLNDHKGEVYSAVFSPDNQLIATASEDKAIKIWDLEGNLKQTLNGHEKEVNNISFSPDGKSIASVSTDNTVKIWTLTGKQLLTFQDAKEQATDVQFSPDGKTIAISYRSGLAKLWDSQGQEVLEEIEGHDGIMSSIQFSPDGRFIGTSSVSDGTARIWNLEGEELQVLKGHIGKVRDIDFSSDGEHLATVSDEGIVRLWDIDGNLIDELRGHSDRIDSIAFSPNGKIMATASGDSTIRLWDISGSQISTIKHQKNVCSLAFFQSQERLLSLTQDKTLHFWDLDGKEIIQFPANESSRCHSSELALSQDEELILSTGNNNSALLRDRSGKELSSFTNHPGQVYSVDISSAQDQVFTISTDGKLRLWDINGQLKETLSSSDNLWKADFSPKDGLLAAASTDGYVTIWTSQGKLKKTFKAHNTVITNLQFLPKSEYFLTTSFDRTARLWNLDGEQVRTFEGHDAWVYSSDVSSDERYLATSTIDGTVYLWSLEGKLLRSFKAHDNPIPSLKFHPTDNILATASTDETIKIWALDESLDKLLDRGCSWLKNYLTNNPEALSELEVCHTDNRFAESAI